MTKAKLTIKRSESNLKRLGLVKSSLVKSRIIISLWIISIDPLFPSNAGCLLFVECELFFDVGLFDWMFLFFSFFLLLTI
jgi:hypothetical protein